MTSTSDAAWFVRPAQDAADHFHTDIDQGLTAAAAEQVLAVVGPNTLPESPPPTTWRIIVRQWSEPMSVMLTIVAVVSAVIGQVETAALVAFLVALNVGLGARQEINARESVGALESLQVPTARVVRDGVPIEIGSAEVVPGDIVLVEAGDLVPADGRIAVSAGLEVAESSLTGESAPVVKGAEALTDPEAALGDRSDMLFQNTSVTRGTARMVVTATGADTEMGKIAGMLQSVETGVSPLRQEIRGLTMRLAIVTWVAVALIVVLGLWRGLDTQAVILLGITTAISSIPSGLPTFLTAMLSYGAQRLAAAKAVVKSLNDVETLGATSAINSDKTGTLTMDMMTATRMFAFGQWFAIEGSGYSKSGSILHAAGQTQPDFESLGYGLTLCGDATVSDQGEVVGDPTEAALVVLAAKMGVDAGVSRREYPRVAEVPFDSSYKFMATFHRAPLDGQDSIVELVKGAPDVLIARCTQAYRGDDIVPIEEVAPQLHAANEELAAEGLRVMSFAVRQLPVSAADTVRDDPMGQVQELIFVALVGIIDPLRPSARESVRVALQAGIDVRMITGDHAVTAASIGKDLGLGPGVITGPEFQRLSDDELTQRLPELHVFGRVAPEDKLRLVTVLQEQGRIVAMTGDAVNDAAALKKADVGVAMGSGSEVSKQSANMILTDNNFATLVHAIELGRDIYDKISAQIRYVLVGLFGLLGTMLLASALNINEGSVLTAVQLIFVAMVIGVFPALGMSTDTPEPGTMDRPPRDPAVPVFNRSTAPVWIFFGAVQAAVCLLPFWWQQDLGVPTARSMTFAVLALSTVFLGLTLRRRLAPVWEGPYMPFWLWMAAPALLTVLSVQTPLFQQMLSTAPLSDDQWWAVLLFSLVVPVVIEATKAVQRIGARERGEQ